MEQAIKNTSLNHRIKNYWTMRSDTFKETRIHELNDKEIGSRWLHTFYEHFPQTDKPLNILDIGTGAGYFAILLAAEGHYTTGIDLTPSMIESARDLAKKQNSSAQFHVMDALNLDFPEESFDVIVTRNLTWTLPDVPGAYREWFRVLRHGGVLLNFDANYGDNVRYEQTHAPAVSQDTPYGHPSLSDYMRKENEEITLSLEASQRFRPDWDFSLLHQCGFSQIGADLCAGKRIMQEWDQIHSPMFLLWANKE